MFQDSQSYTERSCLEKQQQQNMYKSSSPGTHAPQIKPEPAKVAYSYSHSIWTGEMAQRPGALASSQSLSITQAVLEMDHETKLDLNLNHWCPMVHPHPSPSWYYSHEPQCLTCFYFTFIYLFLNFKKDLFIYY